MDRFRCRDAIDVAWQYDASVSPVLRTVAHLGIAALGGLLPVFALAVAGITVGADPGVVLLLVLLVLVGGPLSLLYLWPMLSDPRQRPNPAEFEGAEGYPYTVRSVLVSLAAGAAGFGSLLFFGFPVAALFGIFIASMLLVAVFSTHGRIEDGRLATGGTAAPLRSVTGIRSVEIGGLLVCWLSYARGTGLFAPRFVTVPASEAEVVLETLRSGLETSAPVEDRDRLVGAVLAVSGLLFLAAGTAAYAAIDEALVGAYFGGVLAVVGAILCVAAWRGV